MYCRALLYVVLMGCPLALAGTAPQSSPTPCVDCSPTTTPVTPTPTPPTPTPPTPTPPHPTPTDCGKPKCGGECGDGILQTPEECDLGANRNGQPGESCSADCKHCPVCGDGKKEGNEECDAGSQNGAYNSGCSTDCKLCGYCGDGELDDGEECDNGWKLNGIPGGNCSSNCTIVHIGPSPPCTTSPTPIYTTPTPSPTPPTPSPTPIKPPTKDVTPPTCGCPTCNPIVGLNKCTITTSCIVTPSNKDYCACRAGYRADNLSPTDPQQFRLNFSGQGYRVFVAPGLECNTLCSEWWLGPESCQEVGIQASC